MEDQSANGVKVLVYRNMDGSYVDATCACFGILGRVHSTEMCPFLKRLQRAEKH